MQVRGARARVGGGEPPVGPGGLGSPIPLLPGGQKALAGAGKASPAPDPHRGPAGGAAAGTHPPTERRAQGTRERPFALPHSRPPAVPAFCLDSGWISPPAAAYQRCSGAGGGLRSRDKRSGCSIALCMGVLLKVGLGSGFRRRLLG